MINSVKITIVKEFLTLSSAYSFNLCDKLYCLFTENMKHFFCVLFTLLFIVETYAQSVKIDGVRYYKDDGETVACELVDKNRIICSILPQVKIKGKLYPVTKIGYSFCPFYIDEPKVEEIYLPNSIKHIGPNGFRNCKKLKRIELSDSIEALERTFWGLENLEYVKLPIFLKEIGIGSFCGCKKLKKIKLPDSLQTIGELAFNDCTGLEDILIGNNVISIGESAFAYCTNLKKIIIPNSVKRIGMKAFEGCTALVDITMPDISELNYGYGSTPFDGCINLTHVRGTKIDYPSYLMKETLYDYPTNAPFLKEIPQIKSSFTYFAQERIMKEIEKWQKKKEYETTEQWQSRVTEVNRTEKVRELTESMKSEYIKENITYTFPPEPEGNKTIKFYLDENEKAIFELLSCDIGNYDTDYGVFQITDGTYGTFFASVPQAEAQNFKENFDDVKITPTFGIKDDHIGVVAATFTLGDKTYHSPENFGNLGADKDIAINLPPLQINLNVEDAQPTTPQVKIDNAVDVQIPLAATTNDKTFAVIIGNENYTQVTKVPYANNDAKVFAEYCQKTLGLPEKNIKVYTDATFGTILEAMNNIAAIAKAYKGNLNVIFYYAGHGVPNESTGDAYLLPVDASGRQTEACYPLDRLYGELGNLQAHNVVAFIDACFSGSERGNGMLASARGVAIKAKDAQARGNMVVFTAATGDQTAYPYFPPEKTPRNKRRGHSRGNKQLCKRTSDTPVCCSKQQKPNANRHPVCDYGR